MSTTTASNESSDVRCLARPLILVVTGVMLVSVFWFGSRYAQLRAKAEHVGQALPSMAFSSQVFSVPDDASVWKRVLATAGNWLNSMKIGMAFGVLAGAWLHTVLRHHPVVFGTNHYLNSLKGALIGIPMGVCANCAVPAACGLTRGNGRAEMALGFLFSSPNFNPIVVIMTFTALPWPMGVTKYATLLVLILVVVPTLIRWMEGDRPNTRAHAGAQGSCTVHLHASDNGKRVVQVLKEVGIEFASHTWMLLKPTVTIMLIASIVSALLLTMVSWDALLSEVTPLKVGLVSLISVLMPVPIALDVMFAAQLQQQGVPPGYVMLFAMTLGTYSIIPSIYLWREVSKPLAVVLFAFFLGLGWVHGLMF